MTAGILEIDLHKMRTEEAHRKIDQVLREASSNVYRIRLIHGYHGGTGLMQMVREEYGYERHPKVLRIQGGSNPGITELILREY